MWAGVLYKASEQESLSAVAVRFRTTVRALLRLNPDVGEDLALQRARVNDNICIIPCAVSGPVHSPNTPSQGKGTAV